MPITDEINSKRPISPHLSIYKPQISSIMSIFHRLTGVALFIGFAILAWWMTIWIFSKFDHHIFNIINYLFVRIALYAMSGAFFYHLCNGVRHLFWDIGIGYSLPVMHKSGWAALICAAILTVIFIIITN